MWPQLRTHKEKGMVLVLVLIVLMVMGIFSITMFSQSMSQSKTSHAEVDAIVAEQLAKGIFWSSFYNTTVGGNLHALPNLSSNYTINNRTFSPSETISGNNINVTVSY
jgi:hypothetical protein